MTIDNRKKIILILIDNLYVGGAQKQLLKQSNYYNYDKFEIHLLSFDSDLERENIRDQFNSNVHCRHINVDNVYDIAGWYSVTKFICSLRPDLMMSSLFNANTIARIVGLFRSIPVIIRYHNTDIYKSILHKIIDKLLVSTAKKIVCVSDEVAEYIQLQVPKSKSCIRVIENGVEMVVSDSRLRQETRKSLRLSEDEVLVLNVGRLVKQKNQDLLLRGFAAIHSRYPFTRLCIVGDGGQMPFLTELAKRLAIQDRITFVGYTDNVIPYYMAADVYVSTSYVEGMSNTQLEALSAGLPLLATKTGGSSRLLQNGKNGFAIDESNPDAVLKAFVLFLNSDRPTLQHEALETAKRFDVKATVANYEALWLETAKKG